MYRESSIRFHRSVRPGTYIRPKAVDRNRREKLFQLPCSDLLVILFLTSIHALVENVGKCTVWRAWW